MSNTSISSWAVAALALALTGVACSDRPEAAPTPGAPADAATRVSAAEAPERVRKVLEGTDLLRRVAELGALLPTVDPAAAPAIAEVFETSKIDSGEPELVLFGIWWAGHDPEAAMAWTTSDWRARQANVIAAVVRVWAHRDPQAAFGTARGLAFSNQRDLATDAAIAGWDESGQPGLLEMLPSFNSIEMQQVCEGIARRRVVALGPEGALKWADGLEPGQIKDIMSVRVASAAAADKNGAKIAGEWARPRVTTEPGIISNYPRRIATRWMHHDPEGALAWLASLPAGDDRDDGVSEAFRSWLRTDGNAARKWAESTEIEAWNEPAIAVYAKAIAGQQPRQAIEIARRLKSESWRESTTVVVGQVWTGNDPEAAKEWLAKADLPEHTRRTAAMVRHSNPANEAALQKFQRAPATAPVEPPLADPR
jgi:hypothetical protein